MFFLKQLFVWGQQFPLKIRDRDRVRDRFRKENRTRTRKSKKSANYFLNNYARSLSFKEIAENP
jgi:hypothetical protein